MSELEEEELDASPPLKRPRSDTDEDDDAAEVRQDEGDGDEDYVEEGEGDDDDDDDEEEEEEDDEEEEDGGADKGRASPRTTKGATRARNSYAWEERLRTEVGWLTKESEDAWIGKRVRDTYGRYITTTPGETPRRIAAAQGVDLAEFLRVNVKRWYETLKASSWVEEGTHFFLPAPKDGEKQFMGGKIVGVNELIQAWHIKFDDGDECDLAYDEVSDAIWNARVVDEEWKTDPKDNKLLGRRVRRPFGYGFAKGTIVAYLPEGNLDEEEYEMWHVIHDHDGDHEDLEKAEIDAALTAWEHYKQTELARSASGADTDAAKANVRAGKGEPREGAGQAASFEEGENVLAENRGIIYQAKILQISEDGEGGGGADGPTSGEDRDAGTAADSTRCLVHYQGWKKRFDEWVPLSSLYKPDDPVALVKIEKMKAAKAAAKAGLGQQLAMPVPRAMYDRLKSELVWVGEEGRVLVLPRAPTVVQILQQWLELSPLPQQEQVNAVAVVTWLRAYFEVALPSVLLYNDERWQFADIQDAQQTSGITLHFGEIYGAEHLLRLLVKIPSLVAAEEVSSGATLPPGDDRRELEAMLGSLMAFLDENETRFFGKGLYQTSAERLE